MAARVHRGSGWQPHLAQPVIPVYKASAFVPYSYELALDALGNFTQEIGKLLVDGYEQLTNQAFTTGSGVGQPTGIVTALSGVSGSVAASAGTDVLAADDVYSVVSQQEPRFQDKAQWVANIGILNALRQIEPITNLFGPNGRPSGQRGLFLWGRTGSDAVVPQAFKILNVT
jgi:HK97 family phage major capsid protein